MHESLYGPGEIIYNRNDLDDRIFFVIKGEVETYTEDDHSEIHYRINKLKVRLFIDSSKLSISLNQYLWLIKTER
jgi:CRP-like cAMP-binding protein